MSEEVYCVCGHTMDFHNPMTTACEKQWCSCISYEPEEEEKDAVH